MHFYTVNIGLKTPFGLDKNEDQRWDGHDYRLKTLCTDMNSVISAVHCQSGDWTVIESIPLINLLLWKLLYKPTVQQVPTDLVQ